MSYTVHYLFMTDDGVYEPGRSTHSLSLMRADDFIECIYESEDRQRYHITALVDNATGNIIPGDTPKPVTV